MSGKGDDTRLLGLPESRAWVWVLALTTLAAGGWAKAASIAVDSGAMPIGFSKSVPSVGDRVVVRLYVDSPADREVEVTFPDGGTTTWTTDKNGSLVWFPRRYGKYVFRLGDIEESAWVTAQPMYFFVWDETVFRKHVTHVLKPRDPERVALWRRRGVRIVNWAGGEYLSRESEFGDKAFAQSSHWVEHWGKDNLDKGNDGITIDEIYVTDKPPMADLCKAVLEFRRMSGDGFSILPFFSGIEWDAAGPMWDLREADVPCMEENYWGGEEVYAKRWADVRLFNLDKKGAVLSQAPGFFLDEARRGPQTVEEFRADVALCRRIAPEMRGISLFNAYDDREADRVADKVIEDLFFRPVIHLHARNGDVMAQNIGNEDTVEGARLEFLKGDEVVQTADIPVLTPYQETALKVPRGAQRVRLKLPEGMNHVYEGGVFELPDHLNPLQVVWCSLQQEETVHLADDGFVVQVRFNAPVVSVEPKSVWLKGASAGIVSIEAAELSADRKSMTITLGKLREDRYSLRLLSGKSHFRDDAGDPLDGSGNGFCENAPGLYADSDHFAVDFRVK